MLLLAAMLVSLVVAVPALNGVAHEIAHIDAGWLLLAGAFELASCTSFVVVFRHFFARVPAPAARELAWTEMGSGALLPGGGVGSLAVGGWLLHLAGMPAREIVRNSSSLFFFTSAVNVIALIGGGSLLASGLSNGNDELVLAGAPIVLGVGVIAVALTIARLSERRSHALAESRWIGALANGIGEAQHALRHPSWRLLGGIGYLGFDVAVLWTTLSAVGYSPPIAVLLLGYIIGYLANLIPVPGGVGVLEGGLAGTLVLYGAPVTQAAAGVLVYHAIAFWIPSLGGLFAYRLLRRDLEASQPTPSSRPVASLSDELSESPKNGQICPETAPSRRTSRQSLASRPSRRDAASTPSRRTGGAVAAHPEGEQHTA
ncbi:MAG: flippase-like protein [Solirubrobacterales bacterium]|nr:flippase-like protein [Solirubrobacterales bacterium]